MPTSYHWPLRWHHTTRPVTSTDSLMMDADDDACTGVHRLARAKRESSHADIVQYILLKRSVLIHDLDFERDAGRVTDVLAHRPSFPVIHCFQYTTAYAGGRDLDGAATLN